MIQDDLQTDRRRLAEECRLIRDEKQVAITLNGMPAQICGFKEDFGTVWNANNPRGVEWSWHTIRRILAKDGKFNS